MSMISIRSYIGQRVHLRGQGYLCECSHSRNLTDSELTIEFRRLSPKSRTHKSPIFTKREPRDNLYILSELRQ